MLSTLRSRAGCIAACAVLALTVTAVGCGREERKPSKDVTVRTRTVRKPAPQSPAKIETTSVAIGTTEPSVATVEPPKAVTYEEAEAAFNEKRYDEAVELFIGYTARRSENPWGFYMLGLSAWKAKEYEKAEDAFEQALALDRRHVKSWLNLGRVLLDTDRPGEALTRIDEALSIDPESNDAYRLRGRALYQMGQVDDAVAAYRRAIEIDNQDVWSMNNLGLLAVEDGRFDEALPPLARAVELEGDIAVFWNNLGMALEHTGHFRAAEEAYDSAVAVDESYEKASANLSRVREVVEEPGLEAVDLGALARSFIEEIESWSVAAGGGAQADSVVAEPDSSVVASTAGVSFPDSTGSGGDQ